MAEVKLHPDWLARIGGEFEQPYMAALKTFLAGERDKGKAIYPRPRDWFAALDATPPQDVRVDLLAAAYGWEYVRATTRTELDQALVAPVTGRQLIEVALAR